MLVVWEKGQTFTGRSTVSTWIMGIAYRKGLKLREKSKRWSDRFKAVDIEDWNEPFLPSEIPTDEVVMQDLLSRALRQLSPEQRAVVELTYFHGYSYREISDIAGCPVNTVKTRMFHARAKLRTLLPVLGGDGPVR
jgi:RNA polymerase sigma-70 factor (ECF subfamily)